jgi:hypothetical protein
MQIGETGHPAGQHQDIWCSDYVALEGAEGYGCLWQRRSTAQHQRRQRESSTRSDQLNHHDKDKAG